MTDILNSRMMVVAIIAIAGESIVSAYGAYKWYEAKDTAVNLTLTILNLTIDLLFKGVTFFVLNWFHQFAFIQWTSLIWMWIVLIILEDFCYYWLHWMDHNVRLFWAVHVNHHSSEKMNFTVAIRSSVLQPIYRFIFFIPLALFGFEAWQILFAYALCNWWGFFIHTEMIGKLPLLDLIFATPSNHRVHHGSNHHYLDRNMGMFLIIWDRIFGTYQEEDEKVVYGLTSNLKSNRIDYVVFHEWRSIWDDVKKAPDLKSKLMYVFGPPGWSHDNSTQTSRQLRNEYFENRCYINPQMKQENVFENDMHPIRIKNKNPNN